MKYHEIQQGSEEWFIARAGVISASRFKDARSKLKNGAPSAAALDYAMEIAMENVTGLPLSEGFQTFAMRRGNEEEANGRFEYELATGSTVEQVGFITTDCGNFGASPDGLIDEDGGYECKSPISASQLRKLLIEFEISDYYDQVQGCMWIAERQWWDLHVWHPGLKTAGIPLKLWRIERDESYIDSLVKDLKEFESLVHKYVIQINTSKAA